MSVYALQKLLRDVNRIPERREAYFKSPADFAKGYELTERERDALLGFDVRGLYDMGVHGLILLSWVALCGALNGRKGEVVAYEAVKPSATGVGLMSFPAAA
jgi:hypothetical protein